MALTSGQRLGSYEIVAPLGAGGMGEVYRARDTKLKREVALKVLPEHFTTDPERLARFQREAEVLASLNHPHIAHIHGLEEADGVRALVLELVEGPTLADRLADGPLLLDEALPIARQIAEALEAAHEQGIIHRDLKPANIKLRADGTVKVLDFGLAKAMESGSAAGRSGGDGAAMREQSPTITTPAMTMQGMILGTAAYMSPEQAKGRTADKRSDIWAFGCVLYEMITARRAFEGEDVSDTLAAVLRAEPDWTALPHTTPPGVRLLLKRCLDRDRRTRVADLSTVRYVFDDAPSLTTPDRETAPSHSELTPSDIATAVARARRHLLYRRVLPAFGVLLVSLLIAGAALWRSRAAPAPRVVTRFTHLLPDGQILPATGRAVLAISNDGTQFAYVSNNRILVRRLSEFDSQVIPGSDFGGGGIHSLAFSPDDRALTFYNSTDTSVKRVNVSGGAAVSVCTADPPFGVSWDAIGILLGQGSKGIIRCPSNGGPPETLAAVNAGEEAHAPQLLPGSRVAIFTVAKLADGPARWDKAQIVAQPIGSSERKVLISGGSDARYLPTGHLVYALGGIVFAVGFDPERLEVTSGAVPVLEGVRRTISSTTGLAQFATSSTGTLLYVPGPARTSTDGFLGIAARDGTVTRVQLPSRPYEHVRASRDGRRLAVGTDDGKEAIVWIYDLDGTSSIRRLTVEGRNRFPIWSPDGQRIALQSDREGDLAVYMQRVDGTGPVERLTKPAQGETHVPESWSPDGRHLSFSSMSTENNATRFTLWILPLHDKTPVAFGAVRSNEPIGSVISPDGHWMAYAIGTGGGAQSPNRGVYVQPFPATGAVYQVPRLGLDFHPVWTAKGDEIVWIPSAASGQMAAVTVSGRAALTFGTPKTFAAAATAARTSGLMRAHDVLPDGRFVGIIGSDVESIVRASELRVVLNWFEELRSRDQGSGIRD